MGHHDTTQCLATKQGHNRRINRTSWCLNGYLIQSIGEMVNNVLKPRGRRRFNLHAQRDPHVAGNGRYHLGAMGREIRPVGVSHINNHPIRPIGQGIQIYLPLDKTIWEPFYCDGSSGQCLMDLGCTVIHEPNVDFFQHDKGDVVVSNPPFSTKREVLARLKELDKP